MSKNQIISMYREWRKENHNRKPNRVIVRKYDDDETPEDAVVCTIGLEPHNQYDNPFIYFHAGSLKGLLELTVPGNGSDFTIIEVLEFYKSPCWKNIDHDVEALDRVCER